MLKPVKTYHCHETFYNVFGKILCLHFNSIEFPHFCRRYLLVRLSHAFHIGMFFFGLPNLPTKKCSCKHTLTHILLRTKLSSTMRNLHYLFAQSKGIDQLAIAAQLINVLVSAKHTLQSINF